MVYFLFLGCFAQIDVNSQQYLLDVHCINLENLTFWNIDNISQCHLYEILKQES